MRLCLHLILTLSVAMAPVGRSYACTCAPRDEIENGTAEQPACCCGGSAACRCDCCPSHSKQKERGASPKGDRSTFGGCACTAVPPAIVPASEAPIAPPSESRDLAPIRMSDRTVSFACSKAREGRADPARSLPLLL